MRYFFHITNGDGPVVDEEGSELPDIEAVRLEAAQTLYDLAKGEAPEHQQTISIEVEDANNRQVLNAVMTFEIKALN
jgi:hypothetical protein